MTTMTTFVSLKNRPNQPLILNWWNKIPLLKTLIVANILLKIVTFSYFALTTRIKTDEAHLASPFKSDQLQAGLKNWSINNDKTVSLNSYKSNVSVSRRKEIKRVLFWTPFYKNGPHAPYCLGINGLKRQRKMCTHYCEFTVDRKLISSSHAVVFFERNLKAKYAVKTRRSNSKSYVHIANLRSPRVSSQHWILFLLEAPPHSWQDLALFENIFNWTMSYRRDADIYIPYGLVRKRTKPVKIDEQNSIQFLAKKTNLVAWINSNCNGNIEHSQRQQLAQDLKLYVQVDIYGQCGKLCLKNNTNFCRNLLSCYEEIGGKYKFYLAFENSLCVDYITEKPFNALLAGMVPIVYGHANYSQYLPNHSYINAMDFKSVEDLGKYLLYLDKNPREYLKYFEWKTSHVVVQDTFYLERAWCSLCERISVEAERDDRRVSIVSNLRNWWEFPNGSEACAFPPSFLNWG